MRKCAWALATATALVCDTTNCPAVGNPTGAPEPKSSSPPDPMDVYTNSYFKNG